MREILAELSIPDQEHPDTWLSHESGWTASIYESGLVIWENPEMDKGPRYQEGLNRDEALQIWLLLSRGQFEEIDRQAWKDGQGPPISDEEKEKRQREAAELTLKMHREFYDNLGPEDAGEQCRQPGCPRGTVKFSVFCRIHHFESLYKTPCPFHH